MKRKLKKKDVKMESQLLQNRFMLIADAHKYRAALDFSNQINCIKIANSAKEAVEGIDLKEDGEKYRQHVFKALEDLRDAYYTHDGDYSISGNRIISSLLSDLKCVELSL